MRSSKNFMSAIGFGAIAALMMATSPASAGTVGVAVPGWTNGTVTCANGVVSVFPVVISNATSVSRTGSFNVPSAIGGAVQIASSASVIDCNNSLNLALSSNGVNFTVAPGDDLVMWLGIGSSANQNGGSHNIALGGLPAGTRDQSWYDLAVTLNGQGSIVGGTSFNSMQVQYDGTGGMSSASNNQNLFNIVACNSTPDGIVPTGNVLSPYSPTWIAGPTYSANQALCAGWMPEGVNMGFGQAPNGSPFNTLAVQTYDNAEYLAFAGSGTAPITDVRLQWSGPGADSGPGGPTFNASVTLSSTPGTTGGWWVQESATSQWALAGLTPPASIMNGPYTTVNVFINGSFAGSAAA